MEMSSRALRPVDFVLSIAAFAFVSALATAAPAFAQAAPAHWSYSGDHGPSHWGDLEPDYATCSEGKHQSPIDIKGAKKDASLAPIQFDYKAVPLKVVNNGHTIQINYDAGSSVTVGGKTYPLIQFHFHKPSEEEIAGTKYDMVIHLVHKLRDRLLVVGILAETGAENPMIKTLWANLPATEGKESEVRGVTINAADLLPADRNYYTFDGSLTTPPCSEGVQWYVIKTPIHLSAAQVGAFAKIYPMNARPIQPSNGREIRESELKTSQ
jgi:carbonic anhydrase